VDTEVQFRWLGVAGIELRVKGHILVIDPCFTRIPFRQQWFGRVHPHRELIAENVQECDFVLVTHAHWDHLMDVPEVVLNTGATTLGSPNTRQLLALLGVPPKQIREIEAGDKKTLGNFQVEVLPAEHMRFPGWQLFSGPLPADLKPPLRARDYKMDACFSFLIDMDGYRLLNWCSEHSEPATSADVLFVSPYQDYAYYESLVHLVQPKVVVPIHWDDFFRPLSEPVRPMLKPPTWSFPPLQRLNLAEFRQVVEQIAPQTKVLIPEMFRTYDIMDQMSR
jgi:L-ascorbate metabolism protein UlaG (beta-lactamase superfamily)